MTKRASPPDHLSFVCVIWRDAYDGDEGVEDTETLVEKASAAIVHSIGLLIGKNEDVHVLMHDYCSAPSALKGFRGHYVIPNENIIRVIPLEVKEPKSRKRKHALRKEEETPSVSQENGWHYAEEKGIPVTKEIYEEAKRQEAILRKKAIEDIENPIFGVPQCTDSRPSSPPSASSTSSGGCGDNDDWRFPPSELEALKKLSGESGGSD